MAGAHRRRHLRSGAEAFAYFLRNRRRAILVRERKGGGAHYSLGITVQGRLGPGLPAARVVDPIAGAD